MPRKLKTLLSLLFFAALLSACNSNAPAVKLQLQSPDVPPALRTCLTKPGAPKWPYTQKAVASYIVKLADAHDDCADKLRQVDGLLRQNDAAITAFNQKQASNR